MSLFGKVTFVASVAQSQGRNHAVATASRRANVIDVCEPTGFVPYTMRREDGQAETASLLEQRPDFGPIFTISLPVERIETSDVTNALLFLVSDGARYVTGVSLPVDAGSAIR